MKVILVADILMRDFDGCNRTLFQFLDRNTSGQNIEFYCISGIFEGMPQGIKYLKVPNLTIPFNKDYKLALPIFVKNKINAVIKSFRPDLIHITTPSVFGQYMQKIAKENKLPVTTIYHTNFASYIDYYANRKYFLINKIAETFLSKYVNFYNNCNIILAPTKSMKNHLIDLGVQPELIKIMGRGVNKDIFSFKNFKSGKFRSHFKNTHYNILFASRLVWEKNLDVIIQVYHDTQKRQLPYNFIIAGDGVAYESMKNQMPQALFLGGVNQELLNEIYNEADLFLFPSVTETFGNVVLEAMTCGLPVVAANGGSNPDVVDDNVNGLLVEEKNINQYLTAFEYILTPDTYEKFRLAALNNEMSKTWEEINIRFFEHLSSVLNNQKLVS